MANPERLIAGDPVLWAAAFSAVVYLVGAILAYTELNFFTEIPPGWYWVIGTIASVGAALALLILFRIRRVKTDEGKKVEPMKINWWNTLLMYIVFLLLAGLSMFLLAIVFINQNVDPPASTSTFGFTFTLPVANKTVDPGAVQEFLEVTGTWMLIANVNFLFSLIVVWAFFGLLATMWDPLKGTEARPLRKVKRKYSRKYMV